jgi:D-alanyl-D-alanine carboxypeptidase/D-alanyl-D-alanine-endopeptidase (penicillin-binding protein 4)
MRFLLVALCCLGTLLGQPVPLARRIERLLRSTPGGAQATWGLQVVDLRSGRVVYETNASKLFVPASNTKLFSSALALARLGPNYRVRTRVLAERTPDAAGVVRGALVLAGAGDPNLSARLLPYRHKEGFADNRLAAVDELAEQVIERGVRRIQGDIVGDDTAFLWEPFPEGWAQDDAAWDYGAPVSALTVNDSAFTLLVTPAATVGEAAGLALQPALEHLVVHNRVRTVAAGPTEIECERRPGSRELVVRGTIAVGARTSEQLLAYDDSALFAALALRDALLRRGVAVTGTAVARHREAGEPYTLPGGVELAVRESAPLAHWVQVLNKISQNLHAEMLLREVARVRRGTGSRKDGLTELQEWLDTIGIERGGYSFADGSGLSRLNLLSPAAAVRLLVHMYRSDLRDAWVAAMPIGRVDGTLAKRFAGARAGEFVHAKTGTISHVNGLSGYLLPDGGPAYAFSILVNGYASPTKEIRDVVDKIVLELLKQRR